MTQSPTVTLLAPTSEEINAARERLEAWEGLSGSARLRGVLQYLVSESLAGRAGQLRAKTIALDVYGYTAEDLADRESVIRVDAGRLRRKLDEYAAGPGAGDRVHILLEKGSYAPVFRTNPEKDPVSDPKAADPSTPRRWTYMFAGGIIAVSILAIGWTGLTRDEPLPGSSEETTALERSAIFDVSPRRLSAINLAEDGRDLIFPALDPNRLRAALQVFQTAIDTDPTYFGGYAGAAQVNATIAMLGPEGAPREAQLAAAREVSEQALNLAPGDPWSQSASAWLAFAERDFERAKSLSERATALDPDNLHLLEFDALISLFAGDFERVLERTKTFVNPEQSDVGFVFTNATGSAHFHLGQYPETIRVFEAAINAGGPIGPASLAYLMAAHQRLGQQGPAGRIAQQFEQNWPDTKFNRVFGGLFEDPAYGRDLTDAMRAAGWQPNG
ncbi:MAG: adenylate cyclase [Pseudomonadota bacterium]